MLISFFPKFKYLFLMGDFVVVIIIIILGVLNEFASNENEREEEKCPNGERKKNDCIFHGTYVLSTEIYSCHSSLVFFTCAFFFCGTHQIRFPTFANVPISFIHFIYEICLSFFTVSLQFRSGLFCHFTLFLVHIHEYYSFLSPFHIICISFLQIFHEIQMPKIKTVPKMRSIFIMR